MVMIMTTTIVMNGDGAKRGALVWLRPAPHCWLATHQGGFFSFSNYLLICLIQGLGLNEQELEMRSILVRVQQVLKITFSFFELLK